MSGRRFLGDTGGGGGWAHRHKKEIYCFLMVFIIVACVILYVNHLPTPSNNLDDLPLDKLQINLKDCEDKSTQTRTFLASKLAELNDLRQKVSEYEEKFPDPSDNEKIRILEDEIRRLQKPSSLTNFLTQSAGAGISAQTAHTVLRRTLEVANYLPNYDLQTIGTNPSYDVTDKIECWALECDPANLNNREAYTECSNPEATTWNAVGVKNMERFVARGKHFPDLERDHKALLDRAKEAFLKAVETDPECSRAWLNLAIVRLQYHETSEALEDTAKAEPKLKNSARFWAIRGFVQDVTGDRLAASESWKKALNIDRFIGERKYFGVMVIDDLSPEHHNQFPNIREYNKEFEDDMARDVLTFIEFSPVSAANYATLQPDVQEFFVQHQYAILKDIIPPFILKSVVRCFQRLRESGILSLGDYQSKRYAAYNSRAGRTLHYQMVDLVRRVTVHNVHPSYAFYGAYVGGAILPPHSDKPQCEFTITLTLDQSPPDTTPWAISLGSHPNFDRDDEFIGNGQMQLPPEDEIVDAYLYPGDCLLFMGRHLTHFRRTNLPENEVLDQIFLHHVQENFPDLYDI